MILKPRKISSLGRWIGVLALSLCLISMLMPAAAMAIDPIKAIPKIKPLTPIPQATFEEKTRLEENIAPMGEPLLGYRLRLPKDWTQNIQQASEVEKLENKRISTTVMSTIARYVGAPRNLLRSSLTIEAIELDREIALSDWFKNHIFISGMTLSGFNQIAPEQVEALYVRLEGDQTYVVRARAYLNGAKLLLISYALPQENYADEKEMQAQVLESFAPLKPVRDNVEKQAGYGFLDQSFFNYPQSWTLKPQQIYAVDRMSAALFSERHTVSNDPQKPPPIIMGQIQISVISKLLETTLPQEVEKYKKGTLNIAGYQLGSFIESLTFKHQKDVRGMTEVYALTPLQVARHKPYEAAVSVLESPDFYYILSLITPARGEDFITWARNMAAFRVVNETIRQDKFAPGIDVQDPYYDYLKQTQ